MKIDAYLSEESFHELYQMCRKDIPFQFFFRSGFNGFQSPYVREDGTIGKGFWVTHYNCKRNRTVVTEKNQFRGRIVDIRFNPDDGKLHVELEDGWLLFTIIDGNYNKVSKPGCSWPPDYAWRLDHE